MVVAPFNTSYLNRIPYLTVDELLNGVTGLDWSSLLPPSAPGGSTNVAQAAAAAELIEDASAIIDGHCFGAWGTLSATTETDSGRIRMNKNGWFIVTTKAWPVLQVLSFAAGPTPGDMQTYELSPANCWPEEQGFVVVSTANALPSMTNIGPLQFGGRGRPGAEQFATWTYVNGWPNTLLSVPAIAGQSTISLINLDGIFATGGNGGNGTPLNIYDIPGDEAIQVSPSWTGGNPVQLVSPLQYDHNTGISVSALPRSIKRACLIVAGSLVKARGAGGISLPEVGSSGNAGSTVVSALDKGEGVLGQAKRILQPFRVVTN